VARFEEKWLDFATELTMSETANAATANPGAAKRPALGTRAVIPHEHSTLDARHAIELDGDDAIVSESWHDDDGSEQQRYEVRLPFSQLVHLALNTTLKERQSIDARADWRGVDDPEQPGVN
jgi:hypothetical protein